MRITMLIAISILACVVSFGCYETRYVTVPSQDTAVRVSGVVNGWYCGIGHDSNFPYTDLEFAPHTGELPHVRFIYYDGSEFALDADSTSVFSRVLPIGATQVIVETRHGRPDTFQCVLRQDTALVLDIVYETLAPDSLIISFSYQNLRDTLSHAEEWSLIQRANLLIHEKLEVDGSGPLPGSRKKYEISDKRVNYYSLKLQAGNLSPFEVDDEIEYIIRRDTNHQIFPVTMRSTPTGNYICHQ